MTKIIKKKIYLTYPPNINEWKFVSLLFENKEEAERNKREDEIIITCEIQYKLPT